MLGKLKLFKDNAAKTKSEESSCSSVSVSAAAAPSQNPAFVSPEVVAASRDSTDAEARRTVAKGPQQDKRSGKGRPKDAAAHGIPPPSSNLPSLQSSSLIPSMDDRKRVGSAAAAMGRTATSGAHPRPSALPSSRTSSSSSISSLSGSGTLGTPVAGGGLKAATASASKSAAKGYPTSGTRVGQRQGTATAIATPTATSSSSSSTAAKSGKSSGVPSARGKPTKSPSTVGLSQSVARSPSISQALGKSPSTVGICQSVGAPPAGKMSTAKQMSSEGARRPSDGDDLNRNRSAGNSGSRTALNSIPPGGGHGMTHSSSRSALQPPQTGRRDVPASSQPDQRRSPHGNHQGGATLLTEAPYDPRRIPSTGVDQGSSRTTKTNQKYDAGQDRAVRQQAQAKAAANMRSPVTVPAGNTPQSSRGGRSDAGSGPDYGFPSVSSFKPTSSSASPAPQSGLARETAALAPPQSTKPRKIDSDTQTTASVMQAAHLRRQAGLAQQLAQHQQQHSLIIDPRQQHQRTSQGGAAVNIAQAQPVGKGSSSSAGVRNPERKALGPESKDQSSSSLNSDSSTAASGLGDDSSKSGSNSASNSNNSASSTDSVIYRPSSCEDGGETTAGEEVPAKKSSDAPRKDAAAAVSRQTGSGQEAKVKQPTTQFTDHISSLRNKRSAEEHQRLQTAGGSSGAQQQQQQQRGGPSNGSSGGQRKGEADRGGGGSMRDGSSGAGEEMMSFDVGIKPMQPIIRSSPYAYLRSIPVSLGRPSLHPSSSSAGGQSSSGSALASSGRLGVHRPLLDPSNMYLSPGRCGIGGVGLSGGRFMVRPSAEVQSDTEGFDVTAGYMSDGDILRSSYLEDVNCGYMSEGGLTQYVKRIQQRFREGMLAVKECMEKSNVLVDDDSADDGSSISSSEISDAINEVSTDENLTGSSLSGASSEQNSYGSIRHGVLGPSPYACRSLPLSHRAYLQQMRATGAGGLGQPLPPRGGGLGGARRGDQADNLLGENWQKYTIPVDARGGEMGSLSRGTIDRATLPVTARERGHGGDPHRGGFGYPLGLPGGIYVKKSHQAVITDLKGRSLRGGAGSGTAVALEEGNSTSEHGSVTSAHHNHHAQQQQTASAGGGKQKRDSETNTDLSAMMMQKARGTTGSPAGYYHGGTTTLHQHQHHPHQSGISMGSVSDCESSRTTARGPPCPGRQGGLVGRGALIQSDSAHYPLGTNSLERQAHAAAMASSSSGRRAGPEDYCSSSLPLKHSENPYSCGTRINNHAHPNGRSGESGPPPRGSQGRSFNRGPCYENYVNVDSLWSDHGGGGPCSRPLSDGLGSPGGALGGGGRHLAAMRTGRHLRTALSETDSVEDLSYSPYGLRGHPSQADPYGVSSRSLKQYEEVNRGQFYSDYPPSASPGNTLHRADSLHMTSASGAHGSSLSLMSSSSSVYSTAEEKQAQEIRKLRRELEAAQEKVSTLTTQLSTNAHVVAAFEQSLSSMTQRLQQLTNTSHQKDSELNELKATIEGLRLQSRSHTLASGFGGGGGSGGGGAGGGSAGGSLPRQTTDQVGASGKDSNSSGHDVTPINRHMSADSVASLNSLSSACSRTSQQSTTGDLDRKKKKRNWLKTSFTKAFSRKKGGKPGSGSDFDADNVSLKSDTSIPNSSIHPGGGGPGAGGQGNHPMSTPTTPTRAVQLSAIMMKSDCVVGGSRDEAVTQLKQELHEKDLKLTDIQLEALASAHQLEQLCDTMNRMKSEMTSLKADNERLQRIVFQRGLDPSLPLTAAGGGGGVVGGGGRVQALETHSSEISPDATSRLSLTELVSSAPDGSQSSVELSGKKEGRRVFVSVLLGSNADIGSLEAKPGEVLIGALLVSKATKWDSFESTLRKAFKEYMMRIEPSSSMGLTSDSILMYSVGEIIRTKSSKAPDQSPFDCLRDQPEAVCVTLKGTQEKSVDCLAFETLIPKAIMQRYVSLLLEHRRIILCGPSGTGKTYLAQKLAEYVVSVSGKDLLAGLVATFNVDHKSSKELRQYLANIAEQCEHNAADLPSIIILDNLHHVGSLGEVFTGFLSVKHQQCPYIIGTMNQTTCSTTNLQLHHNFRWVLCANHMEPVKGFLGRYLRHKLVGEEVKTGVRNQEMNKIADWLPRVWQHLNKFLETHSSSDVTIGPRLFLACPMDVSNAQVWFTDLWNYSIVPYLLEAVREGIQTYGHRAPWEDPAEWVIETYPWSRGDMPTLLHLRTEDVGYDPQGGGLAPGKSQTASSDNENKDPLMNMLLRLQEAASYSSPPSNESDSTSLDSHESRACSLTPKSPVASDAKT